MVLYIISSAIVFQNPSGDCPFALEERNCFGLCGGPPQLIRPWSLADTEEQREAAAARIQQWIDGEWTDEPLDTSYDAVTVQPEGIKFLAPSGSQNWTLTQDFYLQIGCCGDYEEGSNAVCGDAFAPASASALTLSAAALVAAAATQMN